MEIKKHKLKPSEVAELDPFGATAKDTKSELEELLPDALEEERAQTKRFTSETREWLENEGYVTLELSGKSYKELTEGKVEIQYSESKPILDLGLAQLKEEILKTRTQASEVAFFPGTGKPGEEYALMKNWAGVTHKKTLMVWAELAELTPTLEGTRLVLGTTADYFELAQKISSLNLSFESVADYYETISPIPNFVTVFACLQWGGSKKLVVRAKSEVTNWAGALPLVVPE